MLKKRFNLIFAITFIVTLLVAGASAGPYIAKVFAQPTHYPSSFLTRSTSSSANTSLIQITAGKIQDVSFTISNRNAQLTRTLLSLIPSYYTQLAISITSQNTAVTILGPTTWDLPTISSGSGQGMLTDSSWIRQQDLPTISSGSGQGMLTDSSWIRQQQLLDKIG